MKTNNVKIFDKNPRYADSKQLSLLIKEVLEAYFGAKSRANQDAMLMGLQSMYSLSVAYLEKNLKGTILKELLALTDRLIASYNKDHVDNKLSPDFFKMEVKLVGIVTAIMSPASETDGGIIKEGDDIDWEEFKKESDL